MCSLVFISVHVDKRVKFSAEQLGNLAMLDVGTIRWGEKINGVKTYLYMV